MLELLKFFLKKLDFVAIAEFLRKRNNRRSAARLHLVLVQSYEIIEVYRTILDELKAALDSHERQEDKYRFFLNPGRIASLLQRQASNLDVMEHLTIDLLREIKILDNRFEEVYRAIIPHKFGILFEAERLLRDARLPLNEDHVQMFPAATDGIYRTLWFTEDALETDRKEVEKYLYGWHGTEKPVVDVNIYDGDEFFRLLKWYLETNKPYERLKELEDITESYKRALVENFTLEEILSDIGTISRHNNWTR
jgi:hypothetical protein